MKAHVGATLVFLVSLLIVISFGVHAQLSRNITIVFDPEFPKPGDTVHARAIFVGITEDERQTSYQWLLNGRLPSGASGVGKNIFSFELGAGSRTVIEVVATTPGGERLIATKALAPQRPALVWWSDTVVPPWYQGKAIATPNATVTVLAIPGTGFGEDPEDVLYAWSINQEARPQMSGVGRDRLSIKVSPIENVAHQIDVRISNQSGTIVQETALLLPTRPPELLIYSLFPSGGVDFSKIVSTFTGEAGETYDFIAVPFFFSPEQALRLRFAWQVNQKTIEGDFAKPDTLTLKTSAGESTQNTVTVRAFGAEPRAQEAFASFLASFR